jgi:hypothetical protein
MGWPLAYLSCIVFFMEILKGLGIASCFQRERCQGDGTGLGVRELAVNLLAYLTSSINPSWLLNRNVTVCRCFNLKLCVGRHGYRLGLQTG